MSFTKLGTVAIASTLATASLFALSPARADYPAGGYPAPAQAQPPICPPGFVLYQAPMQPGATELPAPTCYQPPRAARAAPAPAPAFRTGFSAPIAPSFAPRFPSTIQVGPPPIVIVTPGPKPFPAIPLIFCVKAPCPSSLVTPHKPPIKAIPIQISQIGQGQIRCIRAPCNVTPRPFPDKHTIPIKPVPFQVGQTGPGQIRCIRAPCNVHVNRGSTHPTVKFAGLNPGARPLFQAPIRPAGLGQRPSVFKPSGIRPAGLQARPAMAARPQAAARGGMGARIAGRR